MNAFTLDTTVLAKGIVPPRRRKKDAIYDEQFRLYSLARSILHNVESSVSVMNVPSVALIEIAAVAARLTGKEDRGLQASDYVREHANIVYDSSLLDESVSIAARTMISGFDSIYIACAKHTGSTLITDDKGMYDAAIRISVKAELLRDMPGKSI
jgi:predicted nucleic acid-binding protein